MSMTLTSPLPQVGRAQERRRLADPWLRPGGQAVEGHSVVQGRRGEGTQGNKETLVNLLQNTQIYFLLLKIVEYFRKGFPPSNVNYQVSLTPIFFTFLYHCFLPR